MRPGGVKPTGGFQRVEAEPVGTTPRGCRQVRERIYQEGQLVRDEVREICHDEHPHFRVPALDERGVPAGIDVRRVVATGIAPLINTGIAGRRPGTGQIGAGVVRAPLACFVAALEALAGGA